jgi:hypothetical protein
LFYVLQGSKTIREKIKIRKMGEERGQRRFVSTSSSGQPRGGGEGREGNLTAPPLTSPAAGLLVSNPTPKKPMKEK